jgi:hypothetical protein
MRSSKRIQTIAYKGELDKTGKSRHAGLIFSPLRRLTKRFRGPLLEIQRSSDDATKWFTPNAIGELPKAKIEKWLAGSDGLLKSTPNQANKQNNFTQTTKANMPKIASSGVLEIHGALFDGTDDTMECASDGIENSQAGFTLYTMFNQTAVGNRRPATKNLAPGNYSYGISSRNTGSQYWTIVKTEYGYSSLTPDPAMPVELNGEQTEVMMAYDQGATRLFRYLNNVEYSAIVASGALDYDTLYAFQVSGTSFGEFFQGNIKYICTFKGIINSLTMAS